MNWLADIKDPDLRSRVRDTLLSLLLLAESSAGPISRGVSRSKPGSAPPPGTSSGYNYFLEAFEAARLDPPRLETLLIRATRQIEDTKKRPDTNRIEMQMARDEQRDIQILLEHGEGHHAAVLAEKHDWPLSWVYLIRERNNLERVWGFPRPAFKKMDAEERRELVQSYKAEGLSLREISRRLGVSRPILRPHWE